MKVGTHEVFKTLFKLGGSDPNRQILLYGNSHFRADGAVAGDSYLGMAIKEHRTDNAMFIVGQPGLESELGYLKPHMVNGMYDVAAALADVVAKRLRDMADISRKQHLKLSAD